MLGNAFDFTGAESEGEERLHRDREENEADLSAIPDERDASLSTGDGRVGPAP